VEETRQYTVVSRDDKTERRARKRLLGFGFHLVGYFIVMAGIFLVNQSHGTDPTKFIFVLVGWGSVLALHAAFVMGLFSVFSDRSK